MGNEYLLDFLKITGWTAPTRLRDVKTKQNTSLLSPTGTLVRQADGHIVESLHLRSDTSCLNMKNDLAQQFWEEKGKKVNRSRWWTTPCQVRGCGELGHGSSFYEYILVR